MPPSFAAIRRQRKHDALPFWLRGLSQYESIGMGEVLYLPEVLYASSSSGCSSQGARRLEGWRSHAAHLLSAPPRGNAGWR